MVFKEAKIISAGDTSIYVKLYLFGLLVFIYYSNRKDINLIFRKSYALVKQKYFFFNRLLFDTNTTKRLKPLTK